MMNAMLIWLSDFIQNIISNLGVYGPLLGCLLIVVESMIPILPLCLFITMNFVALCGSVVLTYVLPEKPKQEEFCNPAHINSSSLYIFWKWSLKYYIPAIISLGFIIRFF